MSSRPLSVLVVDDSALMRNLVSRILESAPDITVCGTAMNGKFALQKIERMRPDCVVLDIEMPEMNGLEFLGERRKRGIEVPVIVLSSVVTKGAKVTMEALTLGASDFILKPSGAISEDIQSVGGQLVAQVRAYGGAYLRKRSDEPPPPAEARRHDAGRDGSPDSEADTLGDAEVSAAGARAAAGAAAAADAPATEPAPTPAPGRQFQSDGLGGSRETTPRITTERIVPKAEPTALELIAIGISTGGPNALRRIMAEIDAEIGLPIVIVQHMPEGFTAEFAKSLDRVCPLEVREAADGDLLKPGRVLIAPGNRHMLVERRRLANVVRIDDGPPCNGHRPSVDVLFESIAHAYGNHAMAVIMTGMGKDGAAQIGEIYRRGGLTVAQDKDSSVVYGMPKVAMDHGFIRHQFGLSEMAAELSRLAKEYRKQH